MIVKDSRDWMMVPLAFLYFLTYPLWWLIGLPKDRRYAAIRSRATKGVDLELEDVVRVRWFTRDVHTIASGLDEYTYFEIVFANGEQVTVEDSFENRLQHRLAERGLLPPHPTSLGSSFTLAWIGWFYATGIVLASVVVIWVFC